MRSSSQTAVLLDDDIPILFEDEEEDMVESARLGKRDSLWLLALVAEETAAGVSSLRQSQLLLQSQRAQESQDGRRS